MSKIVVPKELEAQIVDLYVNQRYTRVQIRKELELPFGDSVILRILKENDVEIRSNSGAQKGGRKKQKVSKELQEQIVQAYRKGWGLDKIVKELNLPFSFDKVCSILRDNNVHIRNVKEASQVKEMPDLRKFKINDDYNLASHNGAWLLGLIAADGYLPIGHGSQNRIVITLAQKDEEVLKMIASELEYTGEIKRYDSMEGHPCSSLNFTSSKLRKQIESYGIGNNKTFKLKEIPRNLPDEFKLDFIRGFFDGDGSVFEPKGKKINMSLVCASKQFIMSITTWLNQELGLKIPSVSETVRVHTIYNIRYYTKDSFTLGNALYNNDFLALPRKKQHYLDIQAKYS